jgi:hypothetical protein
MTINSTTNETSLLPVIETVVSSFNKRYAQARFNPHSMDTDRLLNGDRTLYKNVQPYSRYYKVCMVLCSCMDSDSTKSTFNHTDKELDDWSRDLMQGLKNKSFGYPEIIESVFKLSDAHDYTLPPIILEALDDALTASKSTSVKIQEKVTSRQPDTISFVPELAEEFAHYRMPEQPLSAPAVVKASTDTVESVEPVLPAEKKTQTKKQNSNAFKNVSMPELVKACINAFDKIENETVSSGNLLNRFYASDTTLKLRRLITYAATRIFPAAGSYNMQRIGNAVGTDAFNLLNSHVLTISHKVVSKDKNTLLFLETLAKELPMTQPQKDRLFDPLKPRLRSWAEAGGTGLTSPASPRTPELP